MYIYYHDIQTSNNFFCPVTVLSNSHVNSRCPWATYERSSPLELLRQSKTKFMSSILGQGEPDIVQVTQPRKTSCQDKSLKFSSEPYYKLNRRQSCHLRLIGIIYVYREKHKARCVQCLFELMLYVSVNS